MPYNFDEDISRRRVCPSCPPSHCDHDCRNDRHDEHRDRHDEHHDRRDEHRDRRDERHDRRDERHDRHKCHNCGNRFW